MGRTHEIDVEVLLSTDKEQKACGNLKFRKLPERQVASIIFKGGYSKIGRINAFVARWMETYHRSFFFWHHLVCFVI
jgi:effector-binding domain-containing protein